MRVSIRDLQDAVSAGVLEDAQFRRLIRFLEQRQAADADVDRFDAAHVLWYAGGLIVIGALSLFTTLAFQQMGGAALVAIAIVYAFIALIAGHMLWRQNLRTPGGLLIMIAACMAPLAVFGGEHALGLMEAGEQSLWAGFIASQRARDLLILLSWVIALSLAFWRYPFAFLLAPLVVAVWGSIIEAAPWFTSAAAWTADRYATIGVGIALFVIAWAVDLKHSAYAFWLHFGAVAAFWSALTLSGDATQIGWALYCLTCIGLIGLSLFFDRRVYAVFGAAGITLYLAHLADDVWRDSLMFPIALSMIGLAVLSSGLLYHRFRAPIAAAMERHMPAWLARLRPAHLGAPSGSFPGRQESA